MADNVEELEDAFHDLHAAMIHRDGNSCPLCMASPGTHETYCEWKTMEKAIVDLWFSCDECGDC